MNLNISVPNELYQKAVQLAEQENVSVDALVSSMLAEQVAIWDRLQSRAARGSRDRFLAVMSKVPDVEPEEQDQL